MKPGMILCCGEALTDFIPRLTREGAPAFEPKVGGSVFNTAVALGRLRHTRNLHAFGATTSNTSGAE